MEKLIDINLLEKTMRSIVPKAGAIALRFIDDNFQAQGYQNNTLIPWRKTKGGKINRFALQSQGILIGSGRLRRSFRIVAQSLERIVIATDVPYAQSHNEGYNGQVTVKAHDRRVFALVKVQNIKTRRISEKKTTAGTVEVKEHTRKMNIPMRQFMPNQLRSSAKLETEIENMIYKELEKIFK